MRCAFAFVRDSAAASSADQSAVCTCQDSALGSGPTTKACFEPGGPIPGLEWEVASRRSGGDLPLLVLTTYHNGMAS